MLHRTLRAVLLAVFLCVSLFASSPVAGQSGLHVEKHWEYGRGVVSDFIWQNENLVLWTGTGIWQTDPRFQQPLVRLEPDAFAARSTLMSPDGSRKIVPDANGQIVIESLQLNAHKVQIPRPIYAMKDWSPSGEVLAVVTSGLAAWGQRVAQIELWDSQTGDLLRIIGGYTSDIATFAWHPTQDLIAVSLHRKEIIFEDTALGTRKGKVPLPEVAQALAWRPDGGILAAGGENSLVSFWRADTFEPVEALNVPSSIGPLAWSEDGMLLASNISETHRVGVWEMATGSLTLLDQASPECAGNWFEKLAWSDKRLAGLNDAFCVNVWDARTGEVLGNSRRQGFTVGLTHEIE